MNLKNISIAFGLIITIFMICIYQLYYSSRKYDENSKKIAEVIIYQKENIKDLMQFKFEICDSIYYYKTELIEDTINENLSISDRVFPCNVKITYFFKNKKSKTFELDQFNCAGCSGTNIYSLENEKIEFEYHP